MHQAISPALVALAESLKAQRTAQHLLYLRCELFVIADLTVGVCQVLHECGPAWLIRQRLQPQQRTRVCHCLHHVDQSRVQFSNRFIDELLEHLLLGIVLSRESHNTEITLVHTTGLPAMYQKS